MPKKIRVKRIQHRGCHSSVVDKGFVNVLMGGIPKKGFAAYFIFRGISDGVWITTKVTSVSHKKGLIIFETLNSRYHIRQGWKY